MKPRVIFLQLRAPVFPALEKQLVEMALAKFATVNDAVRWLGIGRQTFYNWAKKHGLHVELPKDTDNFQSALRVLLGVKVRIPRGFWQSPCIEHVFYDARESYRLLAKRYHPDVSSLTGSETRMVALNQAWQVVKDCFERRGIT